MLMHRPVPGFYARLFLLMLATFVFNSVLHAAEEREVPVTLLMPTFGAVAKMEKTTGELQAVRRAGLQMKSKGTIERMFVKEGDRVRQGQILAALEMKHFQLGLDQAHSMAKTADSQVKAASAGLDAASTGVRLAEVGLQTITREYDRARGLREKDSISQQQVDQIEGQYKLAIVGLEAAKKQLLQAKAGLEVAQGQYGVAQVGILTARQFHEDATLTAPFDGLITAKLLQENEPCGEKTVYTLVDDSELDLTFRLPERFLPFITRGSSLWFTTPLWKDSIPATITTVVPDLDSQSRTFLCKALISNADHRFSNGGFVDVNVVIEEDRNVFVVPSFLVKNLFLVNFRSPAGTSLEGTKRLLTMVEREITATIGSDVRNIFSTLAGDPLEDPTKGQVYVNIISKAQRLDRPQKMLMEKVRKGLRLVPGIERCTVEEFDEIAASSGMTNSQVSYSLLGSDLDVLKSSSAHLKTWMGATDGFVDIIDSYEFGKPELRLHLHRERMEALGVNVGALANTMNLLVGGDQAITRFKSEGKQVDVKLRLKREFREKPESIGNILVRSVDGRNTIPVSNLADVGKDIGPSRINRLRRLREISLGANLEGISQGEAMARLKAEAERILPPGFFGEFQGISKTAEESMGNMVFAAIFALTLVYMLLASQFENFIHPLTIMVSVPLACVGAIFALFVTKSEVNILTMIGFLMLMGLVVKNGILLLEFINQLRERGLSREEAIMTAGPIRLRPILMTSACMIGGMIPPAISNAPGSELRGSMAIAIIGGLISSTFLTLIVLPVVYVWVEKLFGWFGVRSSSQRESR